MNFYQYIGLNATEFKRLYIDTGWVTRSPHKELPLDIYCYSRECVNEAMWDGVTSKCRGVIVHRDTGDVIARPFEKFHNFGSTMAPDVIEGAVSQPVIYEKVDGFMATLYRWEGVAYLATKSRFHSVHAKWATSWYKKTCDDKWPPGYTPVFEGIHPDLRIVVDYGEVTELVLIGLIHTETGQELGYDDLRMWGKRNGLRVPNLNDMTWQRAYEECKKTYQDHLGTEEGYVLTWYSKDGPPTRLKMKFAEYLRLHRMVSGVSPKRIWQALADKNIDIKDWIDNSTPAFSKFVRKWITRMEKEFARIESDAKTSFSVISGVLTQQYEQTRKFPTRKDWALLIERPEFREYNSILFAMVDGSAYPDAIWKKVKHLTTGASALVTEHST